MSGWGKEITSGWKNLSQLDIAADKDHSYLHVIYSAGSTAALARTLSYAWITLEQFSPLLTRSFWVAANLSASQGLMMSGRQIRL